MDWYDLLCVQGTLNSLLQHHSSKASILQLSVFVVQLLHPHMTTGKAAALTRWTFVSKVMFLLLFIYLFFVSAFNMLSRFAIVFLPKSKHLLISWLQSPSAVILETKKIKSVTASTFSPSISHEVILAFFFLMLSFKLNFYSTLSPSSKRSLVPLHFLPLKWYHLCICTSLT